MLTHFPARPIDSDKSHHAVWSTNPTGNALFFVHGYGGNALATWAEFDRQLPDHSESDGYDLIFWGYDGIRSNTIASASVLYRFLDSLFEDPSSLANSTLADSAHRPDDFQYERLILVGHSLGAVLVRWALLMALQDGKPWVDRVELVLFAPAHMGARVKDLALLTSGHFHFLSYFTSFVLFYSPLIDELDQGSQHLEELRRKTEEAIAQGNANCLIARKVVIAEHERIVNNLPFCRDPVPTTFLGRDHCNLCKPNSEFLDPISVLKDLL